MFLQPDEQYALTAIMNAMKKCLDTKQDLSAVREAGETIFQQLPKLPPWLAKELIENLLYDNQDTMNHFIEDYTPSLNTRSQAAANACPHQTEGA